MAMGHFYQINGRNEEAIESHEKAVQIALETGNDWIKANAYLLLGNLYTATFDYKNAIECYQKVRKTPQGSKAHDLEVEAYQWSGYMSNQAGQYQESIDYYKQALGLASKFGYTNREIHTYLGLGSAFIHQGDLESSEMYFSKALALSEQVNDKNLQKLAHENLGCVYEKSSTLILDAALKSFREVRNITHDLGQEEEEADACLKLGDIFQELKEYEEAIESYENALKICQNFGNEEIKLLAIQRLGELYLTLASEHLNDCDYDKAIEWNQKALDISGTEPADQLLHEKALTGLGIAMIYTGDTETAIQLIQKARSFAKKEVAAGKYNPTIKFVVKNNFIQI